MGKKKSNERIRGNKKKKKMKTWKKILLVILLLLVITGSIFAYKVYKNGGGLSGMLATVAGHDENTKKNLTEFRTLILGISTDEEGALLTDTIMVASYNPNTQKATLLSIPRDTYTGKNPARATAYEKINSLYARKKDPQTVLKAVNDLTGLDLQYYVIVKTEAFIKLVDAIGGITFNVPIDMDYDDTSQDLHIHLKAGEQKLDGDKAEQLVRFRHSNPDRYGRTTSYPAEYGDNDIGRMRTQREFMIQVVKQTAKPGNIFKLGEILKIAEENVITNIDFNVAKDYIPYIVEFDTANVLTEVLPGSTPDWKTTNNVSIFVANKAETQKLVQELFIDRDKTEEDEENTIGEESTTSVNKSDIKIEVLNGSGVSNNLQKAVEELEGAGYKVTRTGSTNVTSKTTIIDKKNVSDTLLKNVKEVLEVGTIQNSESSSSKVDVTIVIGKDY